MQGNGPIPDPTQAELDKPETTVNVVDPDDTDRAIADDQEPVSRYDPPTPYELNAVGQGDA